MKYPCLIHATSVENPHWRLYLSTKYPIIENTWVQREGFPNGYFELEAEIEYNYVSTGFKTSYLDLDIDLWVQPVPGGGYIKLFADGEHLTLRRVPKGKSVYTLKLPWDYVRKAQEIMGKNMSDWTLFNKIYFSAHAPNEERNLNSPNSGDPGVFHIKMSKLEGRIPSFGVLCDEFASIFGDSTTGLQFECHFFDTPETKWFGEYTGSLGIGLQFSRSADFNPEDIAIFPLDYFPVDYPTAKPNLISPQYFTAAPHPEFGVMPSLSASNVFYTSIAARESHPNTTFLKITDSDPFFKNLGNLLGTDEVYVRMIAWLPELNKTGVVGSDKMVPDLPIQQVSVNTLRLFLDKNNYWQINKTNKISWIDDRPVYYNLKFPTRKYWEGKYALWYREDGVSRYKPKRRRPILHHDGEELVVGTAGERQEDLPPDAITKLDVYQFAIPVGDDILGIQATRCGRGKHGDDNMVEIEYEITNLNSHMVQLSLLTDNDSTRFATSKGELFSEIYTGLAPDYEMRKGKVDLTLQPDSCVKVRNSAVDNLFWADRINVLMPVKISNNVGYIPLRNVIVSQNEGLEKHEQELFDGKISVQLTGISYEDEIFVSWTVINNTSRNMAIRLNPDHCSLTASDGSKFTNNHGLKVKRETQLLSTALILNHDGSVLDQSDIGDVLYISPYDRILCNAMTTTEVSEDITSFSLTLELSDGNSTQKAVFNDVPITYTGITFDPDEDVEYEE